MPPSRFGAGYDQRLDRFDVAVRAVAHAAYGQRRLQAEVGLTPDQAQATREALEHLGRSVRTENGLFELLARCPFLLDHALLSLARYQARCQDQQEQQDQKERTR